jgi:quercetin dioxygenase-like cupin family protein
MLTYEKLKERFIPFSNLRYSTEAFIDYCIPECSPKFNYALIGSGVSQNPKQPVSLREKHGFQVGGISMPHGKTNPPHMHFTAEVFMCVKGEWNMQWGFNPLPQGAVIGEGDIISVPTWIYRGFTNVGVDDGFMFTGLGRDSTGGILWGPSTLEAARRQGVHLTSDYEIIDERAGQTWDDSMQALEPMTQAQIAALQVWTTEAMLKRIVRFADLNWSNDALVDARLPHCGGQMAPVLGLGMSEAKSHVAPIFNSHGFSVEWLKLPAGGGVSRHLLQEKQVLTVYQGALQITVENTDATAVDAGAVAIAVELKGSAQGWDTFSTPADCWRSLRNTGSSDVVVLVMTAGDGRKKIAWADAVIQAAEQSGSALDVQPRPCPCLTITAPWILVCLS